MKKFVVERVLPGAGMLSAEEMRNITTLSCKVIAGFDKPYHWVQSYVTEDKIYCIHIAESERIVREHAKLVGIPIHSINEVKIIMDPVTSHFL
jgi:hypothetical protein